MAEVLGPGRVFIGTPDGTWTDIGKTDGGVSLQFPGIPAPDMEALRSWPPGPVTVTIKADISQMSAALGLLIAQVKRLIRVNARVARANKRLAHAEQDHPGSYSHCKACHPEQAPRPLAVDGREYRRRQLARQRRRRHGD